MPFRFRRSFTRLPKREMGGREGDGERERMKVRVCPRASPRGAKTCAQPSPWTSILPGAGRLWIKRDWELGQDRRRPWDRNSILRNIATCVTRAELRGAMRASETLYRKRARERNLDPRNIASVEQSSDVFEQNRVDDRTNRSSDKLLCHIVDVRRRLRRGEEGKFYYVLIIVIISVVHRNPFTRPWRGHRTWGYDFLVGQSSF